MDNEPVSTKEIVSQPEIETLVDTKSISSPPADLETKKKIEALRSIIEMAVKDIKETIEGFRSYAHESSHDDSAQTAIATMIEYLRSVKRITQVTGILFRSCFI